MLQALPDYADSPLFSDKEKLVLTLGDKMTALPVVVDDDCFAALQTHFDSVQLLELMSCIAWENYRARLNHAMAIGSDDYSEGSFCPMPVTLLRPAQAS